MRYQPNPHLDIRIDIAPGLDEGVETATLTHPSPEEVRLMVMKNFIRCHNCDQSHFVHAGEVLESWRIVMIYYVWVILANRTAPTFTCKGLGPTHKTISSPIGLSSIPMDKDEKREFYKGLRERIKQLRMEL